MMTAEEPDVSLEQKGKEEHFPAICVLLMSCVRRSDVFESVVYKYAISLVIVEWRCSELY